MTQLRRWREARDLSVSELARRSGVSRPDIANVEAGARPLYPKWRSRLATALSISESDLAG